MIKKLVIAFGCSPLELAKNYSIKESVIIRAKPLTICEDIPDALDLIENSLKNHPGKRLQIVFDFSGVNPDTAETLKSMVTKEFQKVLECTYQKAMAA